MAQSEIRDSLKNAVKRQLISDAPIGVFLSGGIDSSILSLLANQEQTQLLKTISIYFDEKLYDERQYQNAVLKNMGTQNFRHLVKEEDFAAHFPAIMKAMDMPTTDGINSWFISKYAHENGLKAVLSGVGADELFGGYPSFARIHLIKYLRKIPKALLRKANVVEINNYKRLAYLAYTHPAADYLFLRGLFAPTDIAKMVDIDQGQLNDILFSTNTFPALGTYDGLHASWFETNLYMQNQLLRDTDIMSMSHGLEVRVPFLDEDFRQLTQSIDPKLRFTNTQPKKILIESFKTILPETVWNRSKMGFSFPLQQWMKDNNDIADEGYYYGQFAKKNIKKFKTGHLHWSKAFALYQIQGHV
jgi:asparagine synthase (glutamine-hydrolysing)